ncbi:DUF2188 domain-containing protein [Sinorhizobium medicae]|nr:DUF2188 domain-containing protein [Sinorhizobium medicae]MDX1028909.1 DUF2188 domain-containing protein [Sinorhizobium medicae]MDX1097103.1 DUF2188 domain-containing protein [Sinorhizobium medicae]MDX1158435.1 DUF2188 domain-containing protein [Sinorhizobium medicae]
MAKRTTYHSTPTKDGWKVTQGGKTLSNHASQKESEAAAVRAGRAAQASGGLGQAVLHKSDGTIREERTYGNDPKKTPG